MAGTRSILVETSTRLLVGLPLALLLYFIALPSITTTITTVIFQVLLGLTAIIGAAWSYIVTHQSKKIGLQMLTSALIVRAVLHIGSAIEYTLISSEYVNPYGSSRVGTDAILNSVLAIQIAIAFILMLKRPESKPRREMWPIFTIVPLASCGFIWQVLEQGMSSSEFLILMWTSSAITFIFVILALLSNFLLGNSERLITTSYLNAGLITLFLSILPYLVTIVQQESQLTLSFCLQGITLGFLIISIGEPLFWRSGIKKRSTDLLLGYVISLAVIPFAVSLAAELFAPGVQLENVGAYLLTSVAAAALAGVMCYLIYLYSRESLQWNHMPILVLFLIWTYVEIHNLGFTGVYETLNIGESLVPYIVAIVGSLFAIFRGVMWSNNPPADKPENHMKWWVASRTSFVVILLWIGTIIEYLLASSGNELVDTTTGRAILLGFSVIVIAGFTILSYIVARMTGNWRTVEAIAVLFSALWILPSILKAVYDDWTVGWWASEMMIVVGLILGPPLIGWLYIDAVKQARQAQRRATLFSDILVHDITNMHQAITVALDLLEMEDQPFHTRRMALEDAKLSLDRAGGIVESVRRIGLADKLGRAERKKMDVVVLAKTAYHQLTLEYPDDNIEFTINRGEGESFVAANELIIDLFYNLFRNSAKYSNERKRIEVDIVRSENGRSWDIHVSDYGQGIPPDRKNELFERYMNGASGLGLGLSLVLALAKSYEGEVFVEDRVEGDYSQGAVFVIRLPRYPDTY